MDLSPLPFSVGEKRKRGGNERAAGFAAQLFDFFEQKSCAVVFFVRVFLFSVFRAFQNTSCLYAGMQFSHFSDFGYVGTFSSMGLCRHDRKSSSYHFGFALPTRSSFKFRDLSPFFCSLEVTTPAPQL